jgi:hypothetical protein
LAHRRLVAEDALEGRRQGLEIQERLVDVEDNRWSVGRDTNLRFVVRAPRDIFVNFDRKGPASTIKGAA